MRAPVVAAAFVLVGAGTGAVAAVDTTGNNIALNGSDTLFEVTRDIVNSCSGQFANFQATNTTYYGGGSGVGAAQMGGNLQQFAPMSRALSATEYCLAPAPASPTLTASLLVGLDGVTIVANTVNSCTTAIDGVTPTNPANGFGITSSFLSRWVRAIAGDGRRGTRGSRRSRTSSSST